MYKIEKILRKGEDNHWEVAKEFPDWEFSVENMQATYAYFVIMFNCDELDPNYYYRVVWS